jgi:hypothetical protein
MKILAKIQTLSVIAFTALLTQQLAAQTAPVPGNTPIEKATNYDQGIPSRLWCLARLCVR